MYSSIEQCLAELKAIGMTNALRARKFVSPGKFQRFKQALQQFINADRKLSLSFEIIHGHAWQAAYKKTDEQEFYISLETLRSQLRK